MTRSAQRAKSALFTVGIAAMCASPTFAIAASCPDISQQTLEGALAEAVDAGRAQGVGLGNEMWGTIVDRDGIVCRVAFSGGDRHEQWLGSRVISAQKANTANAFSLNDDYPNLPGVGRALASGNLYGTVLEQGSLFGLQHSNPVNPEVAYGPDPSRYGQSNDPLVGQFIGGVNVFGGGLALYDHAGNRVGGLGVSGDTSCTDHIVAWIVRDRLGLDNIPGGVGPGGTDNLNLADQVTPNTFQHPKCGFAEAPVIRDLHNQYPPF